MSFNLPFPVFVANPEPADGKYKAADQAAREAYVTNGLSYVGMLVYQEDTQYTYTSLKELLMLTGKSLGEVPKLLR